MDRDQVPRRLGDLGRQLAVPAIERVGARREFSPATPGKTQEQYDRGELSVTEIARLAGVSRQTLSRFWNIARINTSDSAA